MVRAWAITIAMVASCNPAKELEGSKNRLAKLQVDKIANEWFQRWSLTSDKPCPDSILDLAKAAVATEEDTRDPWARPVKLLCGSDLPNGIKTGVAVFSSGPDGTQGTPDDIKSWERLPD
jgi:hypothetical protein